MMATIDKSGERLSRPFEDAIREDLQEYACHRCCECRFTRAAWFSYDDDEALPLCDGRYNEDVLACVKEIADPHVADVADGIPATVYLVHTNQPACFDFERRRR